MKAVVDRFEGEWAVLMLDGQPLDVPRAILPADVRAGHHLEVVIEAGQVVSAKIDEAETAAARQRIQEKLERLRRGEHLKP